MRWEILIIPLIALGVWIIGTLFKSEEEKIKKGVGRRGNVSGRTPGRRLMTDLDRFLEEARRRRTPEERRKALPPSRVPPARPPLRERPPPPRATPPPAPPMIVKEGVNVTLPTPTVEPVATTPISHEVSLPSTPVMRPSPIAQQVRSLLSNPQTAATAFVLHEIFDRPLCKRRR